jgi:hypothetical protein
VPTLSRPRRHMAFVELTEGDLEPQARAACESTLFGRLEATGVATDMVAINSTGCFLTVDERDVPRVRTAAASLNVALRLRSACACVTLARAETNWPLPSLANVLATFCAHGLEALHIAAGAGAVGRRRGRFGCQSGDRHPSRLLPTTSVAARRVV